MRLHTETENGTWAAVITRPLTLVAPIPPAKSKGATVVAAGYFRPRTANKSHRHPQTAGRVDDWITSGGYLRQVSPRSGRSQSNSYITDITTVTWRALLLVILVTIVASLARAATLSYHVVGDDRGPWPKILSTMGLQELPTGTASVFVLRGNSPMSAKLWLERVESGAFLVLEGDSDVAADLGFRPSLKRVTVRSIVDQRAPNLPIVWEHALELPVYELPAGARVFARERWVSAPVMAGFRRGSGGVLWLATSPGTLGYERFPYVLQALADLGFQPPFHSARLWAFFDGAYRSRVDLDYFAKRWRKTGISALHVAAWHNFEPDPQQDEYLRKLIDACHRQSILVYAWFELPHVSEKFWADHPEWREKTALEQDAQLDWRKLINLTNRDAFRAVSTGVRDLVTRFDWDGVNLAELYFESLEGYQNPSRFTPLNTDVRREFQAAQGYDPLELFDPKSLRNPAKDATGMRALLEFRAVLAKRQQVEWIGVIEAIRRTRPHLDLTLTHVDDQFDTRMRDLLGADAAAVLPLLSEHDFTFLIEDPATVWHLGPQRYPQIAQRYRPITPLPDRLAIDINVVERYQDVYPTKQQTGTELFQLVQLASGAFPRVALYFENSLLKQDLDLLPASGSAVTRLSQTNGRLEIDSKFGVGLAWQGPATVNGRVWPVRGETELWLPPGPQSVEHASKDAPHRIFDFNGDLRSAASTASGLEFSYRSSSRALVRLDHEPKTLDVDGQSEKPVMIGSVLVLPKGQHLVTLAW